MKLRGIDGLEGPSYINFKPRSEENHVRQSILAADFPLFYQIRDAVGQSGGVNGRADDRLRPFKMRSSATKSPTAD
jgi:hypothetical protein